MDFTPTEDQDFLRDSARRLLSAECPPDLVRRHVEDRDAAAALGRHLAEWVELGDGPLVDLCLFLEETGAVNAPGPFFATTVLYAPAVKLAGVTGGGWGTLALAGGDGEWVVNPDETKTFVPDLDLAERVAFVLPGPRIGVIDAAALASRVIRTLDHSRRTYEVTVPADLVTTPVDQGDVDELLARAFVGISAEMLGTSRWLFDQSLAYAKSRIQFDRPIGSFQAIQHKLANMALARERAWAATFYAAMAIDAGDPDRYRAAHVAKAAAGQAARLCAKDGIQIHGGIGFTWEHDLHLWMRRAFASDHFLGTTEWHHDRLADLILT